MDWVALIGAVSGPAFGFLDSAVYTDQERAADAMKAQQAEAAQAMAAAQRTGALATLAAAEKSAQTMRLVTIVGAGVAGLGLLVWATRA